MSLLGYDGFDHYKSATADMITRTGGIQWANPSLAAITSPGRNGYGQSLNLGGVVLTANTTDSTCYIGMALDWPSGGMQFQLNDQAGFGQLYFGFTNGSININHTSVSGTFLGSAINVIPQNGTWCYLEIGAFIDPSVGWIIIRVNGQQVFSYTGQTQGRVSSWSNIVNQISLSANNAWIDDFYWCNSVADPGTYPCNTFLGDVRVFTAFPTGNDAVQWTPLAGTNWGEVSETQLDGDTSYNSTATVGQQDTFVFTALAGTISRIICVAVTAAYRKDNAGVCTVESVVKSGASVGTGATYAPSSAGYGYWQDLYKHDPNGTIDWTLTALNAMRAGYKRLS
jgi:hypothetical protein